MTPLDRLRIEKAATDCGFEMTPLERDGGLELRSARSPGTVFVQLTASASLVVRSSHAGLLEAFDGADIVMVDDIDGLYDVLRSVAVHARTRNNRVAEAFRLETIDLPRTTEVERIVVQRIGQSLFRAALLDYWQGRCCLTGLNVQELLRASHIKPWAACESDNERLDVFNGLLLAPHLDALFDGGWMTVSPEGLVLLSSHLSATSREQLGLPETMLLSKLDRQHQTYLEFHRTLIFRG